MSTPGIYGQIDSALTIRTLLRRLTEVGVSVEEHESCHYEEGYYILVRGVVEFWLERIDRGSEYLVDGESDTLDQTIPAVNALSVALARLELRHRMEVYDVSGRLVAYYHWQWPQD